MSDSFRFGDVSGPVVAGSNNTVAGRDQVIAGGDVHIGDRIGANPAMAEAIAGLKEELARLRLTAEERQSAEQHLDAVAGASDRGEAAGHLEGFVQVVKNAGDTAVAGTRIVDLVSTMVKWLGPVAAGVMALL